MVKKINWILLAATLMPVSRYVRAVTSPTAL